uniref:Iron-sulfur flavoprotein n=1 Tax=uncultured bacterium contig00146 TaxID=1181586 RepID=A0A806K1K6_9BACT|nr:iron-sulfur flavoprotein [uncultured bacterium contig00146]
MQLLIVNTIPDVSVKGADVLSTDDYTIGGCTGCTDCWLKTPGVCSLNDDWEVLFKRFVKADTIVFVTEAKLGFVSHKLKNIVDRLIPLALPYTEMHKGAMRHKSRYKKQWGLCLVYRGDGNKAFLSEWWGRVALNVSSKSLGVCSIEESEVFCNGIGDFQLFPKA